MEMRRMTPFRPAALALCAMLALHAASAWGAAASDPRDISGVWWTKTYEAALRPANGQPVPLTPAGKAAYQKNVDGLKNGTVKDFAQTLCVPPGVVRGMGAPYPFEIVQAQNQVTILMEYNNVYRAVPLDAKHSPDIDTFPSFMGDQIGHWDGDTLIIDTLGVNQHTWLDASGLPHGYDLHTVEHIRKIDGGARLEDVITIEDGEFFTAPFTVRYVYERRPDVTIETNLCGGPYRDVSGVAGAKP